MTRRYRSKQLYQVWLDMEYEIPDDYEIPYEGDPAFGYVDWEKYDDASWSNPAMREAESRGYDRIREAIEAIPGYIEHEFMDGSHDQEIVKDGEVIAW